MSLQDILSQPVADIPDMGVLDEGEHELTCVDFKTGLGKNGKPYGMLFFAKEGMAFIKRISYMMPIFDLNDEDAEKFVENAKTKLRSLVQALGMREDISLLDLANDSEEALKEFVGHKGWAIVTTKDDPEYGPTNEARRWTKAA